MQQVGEWTRDLSDTFISQHPEVKWRSIRGVRSIIVHAYDRIDPNMMWEIMTEDMDELKRVCSDILKER